MELTIESILKRAGEESVSDIILSAGTVPTFMVAGTMKRLGKTKLTAETVQTLVYSLLDNSQIEKLESSRELDFGFSFQERWRFRGNAFWQRGSVGAALRLIPQDIPLLEDLDLPYVLTDLIDSPQGLLLVTGPTGHGKSTTIAALVDHINRTRQCHIVTIEDPIEFVHSNHKAVIEQREVGFDTHSFSAALRRVLRQAPQVIMVGEMRDPESIAIALTAAETGHLVLSTLHTNDAAQSIDRIIDAFPPDQQNQVRSQLSTSLLGIVSQRLLNRAGGEGRVPACEILRNIPASANLIRENKIVGLPTVIETQGKHGMVSLDAAIKQRYLNDEIDEDTARRYMKNPQHLFGGGR